MMFQSYALFPHLNAADNVAFSLKMRPRAQGRAPRRRDGHAAARRTSPNAPRAFRRSSPAAGPAATRGAGARASITKPRILLLDEPLSALDPFLRIEVRTEVSSACRGELGISFVHVTHSQDEAFALADLIVK